MPKSEGVIRWPSGFDPERAPVHVRNEIFIDAPSLSIWSLLIRAPDWPYWYRNARRVRVQGSASILTQGAVFRWNTAGIDLISRVEEYIPCERLAWTARGTGVRAYHAWVIQSEGDGCRVVTEETQYGPLARLSKLMRPNRLYNQHQLWLEGLRRNALLVEPMAAAV